MFKVINYFLILLLVQCSFLFAEKPQKTPVFTDYGPVYAVKHSETTLPKNTTYKAVFDVTTSASDPRDHSRRLESVARFINMHALNGVSLDKMDIAVVIHGKASKDSLEDAAYQLKYEVDNPNKDMIEQLHNSGVKFYICGQTTEFLGYKRNDLLAAVKISLSAMTQLVILQNEGYALLP